MALVREPEEKDLMHFTRYAIDFLYMMDKNRLEACSLNERLRERKYWAADRFLAENPKQKLLFADVEGRIVGYILGTIDKESEEEVFGFVKEVYVDEFYRREGIGTDLCYGLMDWMRDQEVRSVQINLPPGYGHIEPFLKAMGFKVVNTGRVYE